MSDNFWARKLGVSNAPAPGPSYVPTPELYPIYNPPVSHQGTVPSQQMAAPQGQVPPQEYVPSVRMKQGDICPGCGSDTYFAASSSHMPICGDCGYNPRFEQQAYGAPTLKSDAPSTPAKQIASQPFSLKGAVAVLNAGGGEHIK